MNPTFSPPVPGYTDEGNGEYGYESPPSGFADPAPLYVRPSLWRRLRDAVAVRRALAHNYDDDDVEIITGHRVTSTADHAFAQTQVEYSAPVAEPVPTVETPFPPQDSPSHRVGPISVDDLLAAAEAPAYPAYAPPPPAEPFIDTSEAAAHFTPDDPGTSDFSAAADPMPYSREAMGPAPGRHSQHLQQQRRAWQGGPGFDRRLATFLAGTLIFAVAGFLTGRTATTLQTASATAPVVNHQPVHAAAAAPLAPAVSTAPKPAPTFALTGLQSLGSGTARVNVDDIRYGDHPGDFRIVFDLSNAQGDPAIQAGWVNPQTLGVAILHPGTVATAPAPDGSSILKSTDRMKPSPIAGATVYEFVLSKTATFQAGYEHDPLRLVIDISE